MHLQIVQCAEALLTHFATQWRWSLCVAIAHNGLSVGTGRTLSTTATKHTSNMSELVQRVESLLKLDSHLVCDALLRLASERSATPPDRAVIVSAFATVVDMQPVSDRARTLVDMLGLMPPPAPPAPQQAGRRQLPSEISDNNDDDDDDDDAVVDNSKSKAKAKAPTKRIVQCCLCLDDVNDADMFGFFCGFDQNVEVTHKACRECAFNHVSTAIKDGTLAKCFAVGCQHQVLVQEVALICGDHSPLVARYDQLLRDQLISSDTLVFVRCPAADCKQAVERSARGAQQLAICPTCRLHFCTNCVDVYHYRSTCAERIDLRDDWRRWVGADRATYWQQNEEMAAKAAVAAKRERARIDGLKRDEGRDEAWKAANCRHCPHCDRLVNKLEGCDAMCCGQDAHGGNLQHGCGHRFSWSAARPYRAVLPGAHLATAAVPSDDKRRHEHESCDHCRGDIVGLRFECVNCESFVLCERCEVDVADHIKDHYFRIHK
jgi:hypothetical protein